MATALTGTFGLCLEAFRSALSRSTAFQVWTGTDQEADPDAAALEYAHCHVEVDAEYVRPCCLIYFDPAPRHTSECASTGVGYEPSPRGSVIRIDFEGGNETFSGDTGDKTRAFINTIEAIVLSLVNDAGVDGPAFVNYGPVSLAPKLWQKEEGRGAQWFVYPWSFSI